MDNKEIRIINIIPSKSYAHRALICDHLAGGSGYGVICSLDSDDVTATRNCLKALKEDGHVLLCGESGSTLRFMLPLAGVLGRSVRLEMEGRLAERPMGPLEDELQRHGMTISREDGAICAEGQLEPGTYSLPGSVSSQFITGLLLSLPHLDGDSAIELTSDLTSSAYVDITIDVLKQYGVSIEKEDRRFSVPGHQKYQREQPYAVEGDWSQAAFWLAAGAAGSCPVGVAGLNYDSVQGDREIEDILRSFGAEITWKTMVDDSKVIVAHPSQLHSSVVDIGEVPDLAPAVAAVAAAAFGDTKIINAGRLRLKESDRIESIVSCLGSLGVSAEAVDDGITIHGTGRAAGGETDTAGDHRIVMMAAVLSLITDNKTIIHGSGAVAKSYPTFFSEMENAGLTGNLITER